MTLPGSERTPTALQRPPEEPRDAAAVPEAPRFADVVDAGPALLTVGVLVWWAAVQGGFATTRLFPGALLILGALLVLLVARPERLAATTPLARAALALGALFAALTLASALWADAPGDALEGGNRTVAYVAAFAVFALSPLRPGMSALLLGVWSVGIAALAAATLVGAAWSDDPGAVFHGNRLAQPIGYVNATCALLLMAFWPAVVLASRRQVPVAARALLLGAALVLVDVAVLAQTRASALALPVTAAAAFLLVPGRVRLLLTLVPVAIATALTLRPMLAVFDALGTETAREAARDAAEALALGVVALVLLGAAAAAADRRLRVPARVARGGEVAFAAGAAVLLAGLAVAAFTVVGDPVGRAQSAWEEFTSGDRPSDFEGTRFTTSGLGDYRADYWRVALDQFRGAPLLGVGADNFAAAYVRERRFDNEARFPHSTPLAVLSATGLVGAVFFLGFVGCALAAYLLARRRDAFAAAVGGGAVLVFVYWAAHGAVDWFWEIPALGAAAFAFLGAAAALAGRAPAAGRSGLTAYLAAAVVVAAAAAAVPPWLAVRQTEAATSGWRASPDDALTSLERASGLNPLSERADLIAGTIANRTARHERARAALERATERNPVNWYAHFELAVAEAGLGRREEALAALARARTLNPEEEVVELARTQVLAGEGVDLEQVDAVFHDRLRWRTR